MDIAGVSTYLEMLSLMRNFSFAKLNPNAGTRFQYEFRLPSRLLNPSSSKGVQMHDHVANIPPDVTTNDIERMQEEPVSNAGTCGNFMQQHLSTEHEEESFAVAVRGINEPAETSALDQVLWGSTTSTNSSSQHTSLM